MRPFFSGNKTDATDARAIWLAVQQPGVKFVGTKTAVQQAKLALDRQCELLMKIRIMQTKALRSLLYKFGAIFAKGKRALFKVIEARLQLQLRADPQMQRIVQIPGAGLLTASAFKPGSEFCAWCPNRQAVGGR